MSLINKMLQDLDARGNPRAGGVPPEVKPVAREPLRLPARRIAAIAAALVAVALGATAWIVLPLKGKTYAEQPAAVLAPAAPAVPAPAAPDPVPVTVAEVAPPAAAVKTTAGGMAGGEAEVARAADEAPAAAPAHPPARAASAPVEKPQPEKKQPAAVRPGATADGAPPPRETTSWAVASERARAEEARLAQRWRAEEARIAALPQGERAGAQRRLREQQARAAARTQADAAWVAALKRKEDAAGAMREDRPDPAAAKGAATKPQGRAESASQSAENSYRRALANLQDGRVGEAIAGLQATLRAHPTHDAARQTLVSLLIESNRGDEAMLQLQQALTLDARQPSLAMLLARLQIERGNSGIDTLLRTLPYASGNGDYHAFLAGALQRQARHAEAVEQYQGALRSAPGNAVWWMGLGIALQADKRNAEALDAFRRAKALGTLSGELQSFVERKLRQLGR